MIFHSRCFYPWPHGGGAACDLFALPAQVSCISHIAANYLNGGQEARRWGTAHESIVPYQVSAALPIPGPGHVPNEDRILLSA